MSDRRHLAPDYADDEGPRARGEQRTLRTDLERLREHLRKAGGDVQRVLEDGMKAQPYLTVGAAAGVGFLLGGGLPRGAVTLLLGTGVRMASRWLGDELIERYAAGEPAGPHG